MTSSLVLVLSVFVSAMIGSSPDTLPSIDQSTSGVDDPIELLGSILRSLGDNSDDDDGNRKLMLLMMLMSQGGSGAGGMSSMLPMMLMMQEGSGFGEISSMLPLVLMMQGGSGAGGMSSMLPMMMLLKQVTTTPSTTTKCNNTEEETDHLLEECVQYCIVHEYVCGHETSITESCAQMFSCPQACKIRSLGNDEPSCR